MLVESMELKASLRFWSEPEVTADFWASVYIFAFMASRLWPEWEFGYDLRTEQFWVLGSPGDKKVGISYYGMTVETAIGFEPYRVMLGGIELAGYLTFAEALIEMTTRLRNTIMLSSHHLESLGYPCSSWCDC